MWCWSMEILKEGQLDRLKVHWGVVSLVNIMLEVKTRQKDWLIWQQAGCNLSMTKEIEKN
jgi:hypothetical protein